MKENILILVNSFISCSKKQYFKTQLINTEHRTQNTDTEHRTQTHVKNVLCSDEHYIHNTAHGKWKEVPAVQVSCGPAFTHTELKPTWLSTSSNHGGGISQVWGGHQSSMGGPSAKYGGGHQPTMGGAISQVWGGIYFPTSMYRKSKSTELL